MCTFGWAYVAGRRGRSYPEGGSAVGMPIGVARGLELRRLAWGFRASRSIFSNVPVVGSQVAGISLVADRSLWFRRDGMVHSRSAREDPVRSGQADLLRWGFRVDVLLVGRWRGAGGARRVRGRRGLARLFKQLSSDSRTHDRSTVNS
jgi:hypothetical protein